MKIAIIDSGIDKSFFHNNWEIIEYIVVDNNFVRIKRDTCINKHGTYVAGILANKLNIENVELISLKILDRENKGSFKNLYNSILFCIQNKINYINISLGYLGDNLKKINLLKSICKKAYENKCYIVAASVNELNKESYPAKFENVIGIFMNKELGFNIDISNHNIKLNGLCASNILLKKIFRGTSFISPIILSDLIRYHIETSNYYFEDYLKNLENNLEAYNRTLIFKRRSVEEFFSDEVIYFYEDLNHEDDTLLKMFLQSKGKKVIDLNPETLKDSSQLKYNIEQLYIGYISIESINKLKKFIIKDNGIKKIFTIFPIFEIYEIQILNIKNYEYLSHAL